MVNLERVRFLSPCRAGSNQPFRYQGKTAYLYLLIIESLIAGRPFLYQTRGRTLYHVAESGVEPIGYWSSHTPIVSFVDGDGGDCEPQDFLFGHPEVRIIVASPPEGANQKWLDQTGNYVAFTKLATRLWSPQELFLIGLVLPFHLSTLDWFIF